MTINNLKIVFLIYRKGCTIIFKKKPMCQNERDISFAKLNDEVCLEKFSIIIMGSYVWVYSYEKN